VHHFAATLAGNKVRIWAALAAPADFSEKQSRKGAHALRTNLSHSELAPLAAPF
jgi:hypothetical protein